MPEPLLRALDESLGGWKKQAALAVYPEATEQEASSRLARILSGELNLPPALIEVALQGPHPGPLREHFDALARKDPQRIREKALAQLEQLVAIAEAIRAELQDANEMEHELAKVRQLPEGEMRRAG